MSRTTTPAGMPAPGLSVPTDKPSSVQISNTEKVNIMTEVSEMIQVLDEKSNLKTVIEKLNEVIAKINEVKPAKVRDRGPDSEREMTEDDARRISLGDLKEKSHKDAAKALGLSYGQIYSARKGFTFKGIYKEANAK